MKALQYANDYSANKGTTTVNIYLLNGNDHFMTRNVEHYYYPQTKSSELSFNQVINIQPAFCGQTYGGHTFTTGDSDCYNSDSQATIYYKMGNSFRFTVPKEMTLTSIIFDALDSSIDPSDDCLLEYSE